MPDAPLDAAAMARALYLQGVPVGRIAARTGLSRTSVYYWVDRQRTDGGETVLAPVARRRSAPGPGTAKAGTRTAEKVGASRPRTGGSAPAKSARSKSSAAKPATVESVTPEMAMAAPRCAEPGPVMSRRSASRSAQTRSAKAARAKTARAKAAPVKAASAKPARAEAPPAGNPPGGTAAPGAVPSRRPPSPRRPRAPADRRRALVERLWRAAERQVAEIETRLATLSAAPAEAERDARALAVLARVLRELATLEDCGSARGRAAQPGEDALAPFDLDTFRRELARRLEALRADGEEH